MSTRILAAIAALVCLTASLPAAAQSRAPGPLRLNAPAAAVAAGPMRIEWEVRNRFRLFRNESDFRRHAAAHRGDGILAAEQRLARATDGRG